MVVIVGAESTAALNDLAVLRAQQESCNLYGDVPSGKESGHGYNWMKPVEGVSQRWYSGLDMNRSN